MGSTNITNNNREGLYARDTITGNQQYLTSTNNILNVNATFSASAISIQDGSNASIKATVLNLTDSNPLTVAITDGNGDQITSFGGGTQYTDGGVPPTHPVGGTIEWSDGSNWQTVSTAKPLPVTASFSPSGTQDTNLKQINGNTTLTGNGVTGTGSQRVTIASDNTAFSVNATLSAETTKVIGVTRSADGSGNLLTSTGNALDVNLKTSTITLPVSGTVTANPTVPTAVLYGQTTVSVTNTAVQLSNQAVSGVIVQALAANAGNVVIGDSSVTTGNGFQLQPGQATSVAITNVNKLYVNGTSGDGVCWLGS